MIKANKGEEKVRVAFPLLLLCGKLLSVRLSPIESNIDNFWVLDGFLKICYPPGFPSHPRRVTVMLRRITQQNLHLEAARTELRPLQLPHYLLLSACWLPSVLSCPWILCGWSQKKKNPRSLTSRPSSCSTGEFPKCNSCWYLFVSFKLLAQCS